MDMRAYFRKQIFLPQDHGSWVFILSPLLIGLFAGKTFNYISFNLSVAAMAAFLIRQPITMAIKSYSGRRPKDDLPIARVWILFYSAVIALSVFTLIREGFAYVIYLAIPATPVFAWHLWLVSRREERRQPGIEIIATGVLSLAAPAAYWVGIGDYDPTGWWLWILVWMQTAASIVHAYLRLEQRDQVEVKERREMWKMGRRAAIYTSFNLASSLGLGLASILPNLIFIPYLLQWIETIWGITHPASGWKPTRIGIRQLIVSSIFTVLFILVWH